MARIVRKILRSKTQSNPIEIWEPTEITTVEGIIDISKKYNITINNTPILNLYDIYLEILDVHSSEHIYHEYITDIYIGNIDSIHLKAFREINNIEGLYDYFLGDLNALLKKGISPRTFFKQGLKSGILKNRFIHHKISR